MREIGSDRARPTAESRNQRIRALVSLLGDEDREIHKIAWQHLLQFGEDATAILDEVVHTDEEGRTRIRARALIEQINRRQIQIAFHLLGMWPDELVDLEKGAYLLAKFDHPKLEMDEVTMELDRLAGRVNEYLRGKRSSGKVIYSMNRVLFEEAGFRGNTENYYSAENSYINRVLTRRTGIPITLSLVYLLIAKRLELPIYGVNMPMHFLCMYEAAPEPFYIDVFNRGQIMTRGECIASLRRAGVGFKESYLERATNREILSRMLRNLILVYYHNEKDKEAAFLKRLLKILRHYQKKEGK